MDKMIVKVPVVIKAKVTEDLKAKLIADMKRQVQNAELELKDKLERAENLEIGSEIGHGTLERSVEVTIGSDMEALMGAEILVEDGKVIGFRE